MNLLHTLLQVCCPRGFRLRRHWHLLYCHFCVAVELSDHLRPPHPPHRCVLQACVRISEHPMAQDQSLGEIVSIAQVRQAILNPHLRPHD